MRVSRIGVAAVHHHLGIPQYSGSGHLDSQQCDDELMTRDISNSSSSYNRCFSHTAYTSQKLMQKKLSVITEYQHTAVIICFAYKEKKQSNVRLVISQLVSASNHQEP